MLPFICGVVQLFLFWVCLWKKYSFLLALVSFLLPWYHYLSSLFTPTREVTFLIHLENKLLQELKHTEVTRSINLSFQERVSSPTFAAFRKNLRSLLAPQVLRFASIQNKVTLNSQKKKDFYYRINNCFQWEDLFFFTRFWLIRCFPSVFS